jgi:hypothetical protein
MTAELDFPSLNTLEYIPYIDTNGNLPEECQRKIGVYAVFNAEKVLQFIGYSRDIYLNLKQHLVRQPQNCSWLKVKTIERPSRTILESIREAWIAENGTIPSGNDADKAKWNDPIDVKFALTDEEKAKLLSPAMDEVGQAKLLKTVARRVEEQIFADLESRGINVEEIRFNPKLKESGLLDLK